MGNKRYLTLILIIGVISAAVFGLGACSKAGISAGPQPSLTIFTDSSAAESGEQTAAQAESLPEQSSSAGREYKEYSFRSSKYLDQHYEKHGAEFGDITKEEYLKLANEMLNKDSETILHKTEKEDGDDVFFDTETGYFLVLSTDGYIRTFFIPNKGIEYFNRQ